MYSLWIAFPLLSALPPSLSLLLLSSTQPFRNHCLEHIGKKKICSSPRNQRPQSSFAVLRGKSLESAYPHLQYSTCIVSHPVDTQGEI